MVASRGWHVRGENFSVSAIMVDPAAIHRQEFIHEHVEAAARGGGNSLVAGSFKHGEMGFERFGLRPGAARRIGWVTVARHFLARPSFAIERGASEGVQRPGGFGHRHARCVGVSVKQPDPFELVSRLDNLGVASLRNAPIDGKPLAEQSARPGREAGFEQGDNLASPGEMPAFRINLVQ